MLSQVAYSQKRLERKAAKGSLAYSKKNYSRIVQDRMGESDE